MAATPTTLYPRWYKRPFESPRQTLYHAYNLDSSLTSFSADDIPPVIDMRVLQPHDLPTHALVVLDGSQRSHEPIVVPIHFAAFNATFQNVDNLRVLSQAPQPPTKHRYGTPYNDPAKGGWTVTLPTLVIEAPHPPSLPLLLLYALWDTLPNQPPAELTPPPSPDSFKSSKTLPMPTTPPPTPATVASFGSQSSIASPRAPSPPPEPARPLVCPAQLAAHLLPAAVLGEFPGYPAQAAALARVCDDAALRAHCAFNGGLWRNVLLLAPRAHAIQDIASNAWNIASAAYKGRAEFRADPARARRREQLPQRTHPTAPTAPAAPADTVAGEPGGPAPTTAASTSDGREAPPATPDASAPAAVQEGE
ncbi:hypothetical protein PsYK624_096020 [Phanerochaete sordida]|uniref:Uncharacterized protein n=1 Tax=Phanerochaete sordida TaxID=48140 RepID=A0A9P3GEI8_9APHY|nr:hypothetical protein PsYK624_096020 [Phanerochaete sordida]